MEVILVERFICILTITLWTCHAPLWHGHATGAVTPRDVTPLEGCHAVTPRDVTPLEGCHAVTPPSIRQKTAKIQTSSVESHV